MAGSLSAGALVVALAAVGVGAIVQGSIGFGFSFVAAPVMALLIPAALPVTLLFLALPMTSLMAFRERRDIDVPGFAWITLGRALGTAGGAAVLVLVPADALSVLFGSLILVAVSMAAVGPAFEAGTQTRFLAGIASGVMGTAAAVGGPPVAIVYRHRPGPELRSTLALSFLVGLLMSLVALGLAGQVHPWHAVLAVQLVPALLAGLLVSRALVRVLDRAWLRPAVLAFAAAGGTAAVVRGLVG